MRYLKKENGEWKLTTSNGKTVTYDDVTVAILNIILDLPSDELEMELARYER